MSIYKIYKNKLLIKPLKWGLIGSLGLFGAYFLILTLANSAQHAMQQFIDLWYWMVPLILGFGLQIGLFVYVKQYAKIKAEYAITSSTVATAGGISVASMIACCTHHVADIIPILGFSAAAMFIARYQSLFLAIGVISNIIGITMMLKMIQKHHLFVEKSVLGTIMKVNMKKALYITIGVGIIILSIILINILK